MECSSDIAATPAPFENRGSIGKPPHIDDHDVLVLQLSGSKLWTLLEDSRAKIRAEVTLGPKDLLYLPQGQNRKGKQSNAAGASYLSYNV